MRFEFSTPYLQHSQRFFFFYWRYNSLWVCILQPCNGAIALLA